MFCVWLRYHIFRPGVKLCAGVLAAFDGCPGCEFGVGD